MTGKNRGFGLVQLIVSMAILGLLLTGFYRFVAKSSRETKKVMRRAELSRGALELERRMRTMLKNLGYNPLATPYSTDPVDDNVDTDPQCTLAGQQREAWMRRIGPTYIGFSEFQFTSDDNELYEALDPEPERCNPDCRSGKISTDERYGFWTALNKAELTTRGDFSGRTLPSAAPCTYDSSLEPPEPFDQTYFLVARIKKYVDEAGTNYDAVLADNVLCLEFRYFKRGEERVCWDTDAGGDCNVVVDEERWVRLWEGAENKNYRPVDPTVDADTRKAYFEFIKNYVHRIEVGVLLKGSDDALLKGPEKSRNELVHFSVSFDNLPWRYTYLTGGLPGVK